jgi:hypothetical protein
MEIGTYSIIKSTSHQLQPSKRLFVLIEPEYWGLNWTPATKLFSQAFLVNQLAKAIQLHVPSHGFQV